MPEFIQGITVQSSIHNTVYGWGFSLPVCICAIVFICNIITIIIGIKDSHFLIFLIGMVFAVAFMILGLNLANNATIVEEYDTYEVTLDGTIDMQKFAEKYVVIRQDNDIFEIKLKTS